MLTFGAISSGCRNQILSTSCGAVGRTVRSVAPYGRVGPLEIAAYTKP